MRAIAVCNQKGGTTKTTTTMCLAGCLAALGQKVLLIDMDPQADSTTWLGCIDGGDVPSLLNVLMGKVDLRGVVQPSGVEGLDIVASSQGLAAANVLLASSIARERKLRKAIEKLDPEWDFILVDCPPGAELLSLNALVAVQEVLIPVPTEPMPLGGVARLWSFIEEIKSELNPELRVSGLIATVFDSRERVAKDVLGELQSNMGHLLMDSVIRKNVRIKESYHHSQPIHVYAPSSNGAKDYMALSKEILGRQAA